MKPIMKTLFFSPVVFCKKVSLTAGIILVSFLLLSTATEAQSASTMPKLGVQLLLNMNGGSQNTADAFVVAFDPSFSSTVGPEDSYKFTNLDENIAVNRNGITLSIEGRPTISSYDTIPIKVWQYRHTNYCLKFTSVNFPSNLVAVLKDNYLQQDFQINLDSISCFNYDITSDPASSAADRLCIVFKPASTLSLGISDLSAYTKDKGIQLEWKSLKDEGVNNYTIEKSANGIQFSEQAKISSKETGSLQTYSWYDAMPVAGTNFYRIKVLNKSGGITNSSIVKVNMIKASNSSMSIFPNPVKGERIGLQLDNLNKGNYKAILYNNSGQVVFTQIIVFEGGSASKNLQLNNAVKKGVYTLLLVNEENKLSTRVIID